MSLIHGPKKAPTAASSPSMLKKAGNYAKNKAIQSGGLAAIRAAEELLGVRMDAAPAYLFYVSISGMIVALFTGVDGIEVKRHTEEVEEGGLNDGVHILPGPVKAGRITLKRGISINRTLWDWFNKGLYDCKVERYNVSVIQGAPGLSPVGSLMDKSGNGIIKMWNMDNAYPVSWSLSSLDVNNTTQVAIESLEIAFRTLELSKIMATPMSPTALL